MPGFVETQIYNGYGYLDPYVSPYVSPYVEKARHSVPLIDRAAKGAEEFVPKLITRVDEFTEPRVEKIRPIVEPRIEQVKEIATPYVDSGINRYESIRKESITRYENIMEYKNTKVETVQKIKDAKINWCKKMLSKKGDQVNQLFRVPATDNVEGLKFQGVLGKMAALLQKTEGLVDKLLPALPKGAKSPPLESEYDDSYLLPRMFLLAVSVQTRLVHATKTKCEITMVAAKTKCEKTKCDVKGKITYYVTTGQTKFKAVADPKVKQLKAFVDPKVKQVKAKIEPKVMQLKAKVEPKIQAVMKTKQYKQACDMACKGMTFSVQTCEKIIGKEKTKSMIQKVESLILKAQKAVAPPAPTKKMK